MKQSEAAKAFFRNTPVDGHVSVMIESISQKVTGIDHLVDVECDSVSGSNILKLVVFLPESAVMADVYQAAQESDRKLANAGVDFYIAEG